MSFTKKSPVIGKCGISYEWTSKVHKKKKLNYFYSPVFLAESLDKTKWQIILHFEHEDEPLSGYIARSSTDDGPELITVSCKVFVILSDSDFTEIFLIKNAKFRKGEKRYFEDDTETLEELNESLWTVPTQFCCEVWKSDCAMSETTMNTTWTLANAISRLWNHQPYASEKDKTVSVSSDQPSTSKTALEAEEFWIVNGGPSKFETRMNCRVRIYGGITVFDEDDVIEKEEKAFTFRYEANGEGCNIRNILASEAFKDYCLSNDGSTEFDGCGESANIIENLISYLRETNFPDVFRKSRHQCACCESQISVHSLAQRNQTFAHTHGSNDTRKSSVKSVTRELQALEPYPDSAINIAASESNSTQVPHENHNAKVSKWNQNTQIPYEGFHNFDLKKKEEEYGLEFELFRAFKDGLLSEVIVCAGEQQWRSHEVILSTRSCVLRGMLKNKTESGILKLSNVDPDTVDAMLTFLYSDTLPESLSAENAAKLYSAAQKYQIFSLIDLSSAFLKSNLSVLNVCNVYLLAEMHQDNGLKMSANDFFCGRAKEIIHSEE